MDFINQATAQLSDAFRQMSPGTRLVSGLLLVAVVISLFYLVQYQGTGGDEFLLNGRSFAPSEMTAIEASFAKAGLGLSIVEGSRIRIPHGQKDLYLAAMADANALPADFYKYLDEANSVDNPFVSSRSMELKHKNAKQKELALIISRMEGIQSATVQFDEIESNRFRREKQMTAMVAVQSASGMLDSDRVKAIRNIVASSYAGLERGNVTITDIASGLSFSATDGSGQSPDESMYASHKEKFERDWRQKITQQLSMISNVIVGVNVELNPELQHMTTSIKLDPKPVTVSTTEFTKENSSTQPAQAGRPGAVPNGVGNQPVSLASSTSVAGPSSQNSESRSDVRNVAGHEQVSFQKAPLVPTKVTASIDIPRSYYVKVWREQQPAGTAPTQQPAPADLDKIETATITKVRETVRNLLPAVTTGTDPYPNIVVSSYTDLPSAPLAQPTLADNSMTWVASNWQTLALVVVGLFALLSVRSLAKGAMTPPPAGAMASGESGSSASSSGSGNEEDEEEMAYILKRKLGDTGPNLKEELAGLVKDDPDAAATILRAWIGDAA